MDDSATPGTRLAIEAAIIFGLSILWSIGNYALARRLGKNKLVWTIVTLIPVVNFFFFYYVLYQAIFGILDRLPPRPRPDA